MSSELFDILNNQENKELFKVRGREITNIIFDIITIGKPMVCIKGDYLAMGIINL